MRQLGNASLQTYRWDVVYLVSSLMADEDTQVQALVPIVSAMLDDIRLERELYERAEEGEIAASAVRVRRDTKLDRGIITFGGVLRAVAPAVYERFFSRLSPSRVARLGLDAEIREVNTILAHFDTMPADDPVRLAHEPIIRADLEALELAKASDESADVSLTVARARLSTFRARIDRQRVEIFGQLVAILGSKDLADSYFRPTRAAPKGGDTPPPADDPASPQA